MKKFLLRAFLLLLPFIAFDIYFINSTYWKDLDLIEKFKSVPEKIDIVNTGNSHAQFGIFYENLPEGKTGFNMALSGQEFEYDYRILKQYIPNLKENAVVIIPVSDFELLGYLSHEDLANQEYRYYRFLKSTKKGGGIEDWNILKFIKYNYFAAYSVTFRWEPLLKQMTFPAKIQTKATYNLDLYNFDVEEKFKKWMNLKNDGKNLNDLYNILDLCKEHNFQPVIITIPITNAAQNKIDELQDFASTKQVIFNNLQTKYENLLMLDYSHSLPEISSNLEFYMDADHLNYYGGQAFSAILIEDLIKHNKI